MARASLLWLSALCWLCSARPQMEERLPGSGPEMGERLPGSGPEMGERLPESGSVAKGMAVTACCQEGEHLVVRKVRLPRYALHQEKSLFECVPKKSLEELEGRQIWTENEPGKGGRKTLEIVAVKTPSCGRGVQMIRIRINSTENQVS